MAESVWGQECGARRKESGVVESGGARRKRADFFSDSINEARAMEEEKKKLTDSVKERLFVAVSVPGASAERIAEEMKGDEDFRKKIAEEVKGDEAFKKAIAEEVKGDEDFRKKVAEEVKGDEDFRKKVAEEIKGDEAFKKAVAEELKKDEAFRKEIIAAVKEDKVTGKAFRVTALSGGTGMPVTWEDKGALRNKTFGVKSGAELKFKVESCELHESGKKTEIPWTYEIEKLRASGSAISVDEHVATGVRTGDVLTVTMPTVNESRTTMVRFKQSGGALILAELVQEQE